MNIPKLSASSFAGQWVTLRNYSNTHPHKKDPMVTALVLPILAALDVAICLTLTCTVIPLLFLGKRHLKNTIAAIVVLVQSLVFRNVKKYEFDFATPYLSDELLVKSMILNYKKYNYDLEKVIFEQLKKAPNLPPRLQAAILMPTAASAKFLRENLSVDVIIHEISKSPSAANVNGLARLTSPKWKDAGGKTHLESAIEEKRWTWVKCLLDAGHNTGNFTYENLLFLKITKGGSLDDEHHKSLAEACRTDWKEDGKTLIDYAVITFNGSWIKRLLDAGHIPTSLWNILSNDNWPPARAIVESGKCDHLINAELCKYAAVLDFKSIQCWFNKGASLNKGIAGSSPLICALLAPEKPNKSQFVRDILETARNLGSHTYQGLPMSPFLLSFFHEEAAKYNDLLLNKRFKFTEADQKAIASLSEDKKVEFLTNLPIKNGLGWVNQDLFKTAIKCAGCAKPALDKLVLNILQIPCRDHENFYNQYGPYINILCAHGASYTSLFPKDIDQRYKSLVRTANKNLENYWKDCWPVLIGLQLDVTLDSDRVIPAEWPPERQQELISRINVLREVYRSHFVGVDSPNLQNIVLDYLLAVQTIAPKSETPLALEIQEP